MPLKHGSSRAAISSNIAELTDSYKRKGRIGNAKPKNLKAARRMAVAISLKKAGRSKYDD